MATKEILSLPLTNGDKALFLAKKSGGIYRATMNTTTSTATAFVVTADDITELYDGITLIIKNTKIASAKNCTLNLNGLGAKRIWLSQSNSYCTTHWALNQTYLFVYDATNARWELQQGRDTTTSNATQLQHNGGVKAGSYKILNGNIVVADPTTHLYKHLKDGTNFDISMPIFYLAADCDANTVTGNVYSEINMNRSVTQSSLTLTTYLPVFIKGTLNGIVFTPISTTPLTQTIPTEADGYTYIYLGMAYSTTTFRLVDRHPMFAFINGAFRFISDTANYATNSGTATYATNAGTAAYGTKSGTATYATNSGTATYGTNAGTAAYGTKSGTATYATNAGTATHANDAITTVSASGRTVTFTKGNGGTFSITTQDNNTTYGNFTAASSSAAGTAGLVPAPTAGQQNYILTGSGWKSTASAAYATNAGSATYATNAGTATHANDAVTTVSASGRTVTFTKGNGGTFSITTQDNNTTYANFTAPTSSAAGTAGLVPAPAANTMNYVLTASGWKNTASVAYATNAGTATSATKDSSGNQINTTYIKNASVSGRTITFTKGNGSTFSFQTQDTTYTLPTDYMTTATVSGKDITFTIKDGSTFKITTQDTNTTYANFTAPTASVAGTAGLVPAPAANTMNYILTASGWKNTASAAYATKAGTATYATNGGTATYANSAGKATKDSADQQINTTYIKNASVSGKTVTFTKGDGSTFSITTQDNNTTYADMTAATTSTDGAHGLVPKPTSAAYNYVLSGHGWVEKANKASTADYATNAGTAAYGTKSGTATYATNAGTATYATSAGKATKDSADQQINTTYIKNASVSGRTITFTKGNGGTFSITTQDNNTTYGNFTPATTAAAGAAGLVPAPTSAQYNYFLSGHSWTNTIDCGYES